MFIRRECSRKHSAANPWWLGRGKLLSDISIALLFQKEPACRDCRTVAKRQPALAVTLTRKKTQKKPSNTTAYAIWSIRSIVKVDPVRRGCRIVQGPLPLWNISDVNVCPTKSAAYKRRHGWDGLILFWFLCCDLVGEESLDNPAVIKIDRRCCFFFQPYAAIRRYRRSSFERHRQSDFRWSFTHLISILASRGSDDNISVPLISQRKADELFLCIPAN